MSDPVQTPTLAGTAKLTGAVIAISGAAAFSIRFGVLIFTEYGILFGSALVMVAGTVIALTAHIAEQEGGTDA